MQSVHLSGSDDVARAASTMRSAADEMSRAASNMRDALECHQRFLDDWLQRLDGTITDRISDLRTTIS